MTQMPSFCIPRPPNLATCYILPKGPLFSPAPIYGGHIVTSFCTHQGPSPKPRYAHRAPGLRFPQHLSQAHFPSFLCTSGISPLLHLFQEPHPSPCYTQHGPRPFFCSTSLVSGNPSTRAFSPPSRYTPPPASRPRGPSYCPHFPKEPWRLPSLRPTLLLPTPTPIPIPGGSSALPQPARPQRRPGARLLPPSRPPYPVRRPLGSGGAGRGPGRPRTSPGERRRRNRDFRAAPGRRRRGRGDWGRGRGGARGLLRPWEKAPAGSARAQCGGSAAWSRRSHPSALRSALRGGDRRRGAR